MYYKIRIDSTGKPRGKTAEGFSIFHQESKEFKTIEEVKEYIKSQYGKCKRVKTYRDGKDGKAIHSGYIYSFNNQDWSHSDNQKWHQQDWIEITKVEEEVILI